MALDVPVREGGILRLFAVNTEMPEGAALRRALTTDDLDASEPAAQALGIDRVDAWWVTHLQVEDLTPMDLPGFLREGYDVPDAALAEARPALDAATGDVMVVQSPAFEGRAETLAPAGYLTPIAAIDTNTGAAPARAMARAEIQARAAAPDPAAPGARRRVLRPAAVAAVLAITAVLVALFALTGGGDGL